MHSPSYAIGRSIARFVGGLSLRHQVTGADHLLRPGPFVLACTHLSHFEPAMLSAWLSRPIHWVAREEFYRVRPAAALLNRLGAIRVDRRGVAVSTIRESVRRLNAGGIVGIFPEGGRTHGDAQVIRGGPIKGGACLIAMRAGVPIVPVVVVGLEAMHRVAPWLPGQRTTVRTIAGKPIFPGPAATRSARRACRLAMTETLRRAFVRLHAEGTA